MKKLKLRKWVKVVISVIVVMIGIIIYSGLSNIGIDASSNKISGFLCILGWLWIFFGQFAFLSVIWGD